ncbi:hypothetical protein P154DRAFT_340040 [Amniculicola lignicola CBS 123094]|uniref:Uncharacterized protein n=1 Tax=Amniculicola lignicola CBS 123094 TaxID=1392246 RepID=A0A6A5WD70_9PLEO|nr:hypothetical protein P154DRAFT_340040 [Amniculicola lignicola CBS 123094]
MALTDMWLTAVHDAGGDFEPPLDPQIPAEYLQKPRRQRPRSEQTLYLSSRLPSPPTSFSRPRPRRAVPAEISISNDPRPQKRRRMPNAPTPVMSPASRSPSKMLSRIAARNKAPAMEDVLDPNVTPRAARTRRKLAPAMSFPALDGAAMPALTPGASEGEVDIDSEEMECPTASVTESTGSKARSRSPTKRMVDLRVAEKTVILKAVKSATDVPEDVRGLYRAIQSLARVPRSVIPLGIEVRPHTYHYSHCSHVH